MVRSPIIAIAWCMKSDPAKPYIFYEGSESGYLVEARIYHISGIEPVMMEKRARFGDKGSMDILDSKLIKK